MTLYAYIRVSRPDEATILENQRIRVVDYAAARRMPKPDIFDETVSGGELPGDRGLGVLLRKLRPGDLVLFTSLSRMTRGGIGAALDILRQIEHAGAGWHFIEQPVLNYDAGTAPLARDILLAVFASIDEDYRRRISSATRAAFARKKAGGWHGKGRKPGAKDRGPRRKKMPSPPVNEDAGPRAFGGMVVPASPFRPPADRLGFVTAAERERRPCPSCGRQNSLYYRASTREWVCYPCGLVHAVE